MCENVEVKVEHCIKRPREGDLWTPVHLLVVSTLLYIVHVQQYERVVQDYSYLVLFLSEWLGLSLFTLRLVSLFTVEPMLARIGHTGGLLYSCQDQGQYGK